MIYAHNIKIDIPVLKVDSIISYQTVRRPTVFEKSLLQLFAKYSVELGDRTLEDIANHLKLCSTFFIDALRHLNDFRAIQLSNDYSIDDALGMQCNCILITSEGREFLSQNALPSENKYTTETSYYDPLLGKIVGKNDVKSTFGENPIRLPIDSLDVTLSAVKPLIDEKLRQRWKSKVNERIDKIEPQLNGEIWDRKVFKIDIDHNGNITPMSKDVVFSKWLEGAEAEYLWQFVISPVFSSDCQHQQLQFDWNMVHDVAPIGQITAVINKLKPHYLLTFDKNIETANVASVVVDPSSNPSLKGNVLTLSRSPISLEEGADALLVHKSNGGFDVQSGLSQVWYSGQPREVDLTIITQADNKKEQLEQYLLTSEDINVVIFSAVIDCNQAIKRLPCANIKQVVGYYNKMNKLVTDLSVAMFKQKFRPLRNKEEVEQCIHFLKEKELSVDSLTTDCLITLINSAIRKIEVIAGLSISKVLSDLVKTYDSINRKIQQDLLNVDNFKVLKLNVSRYQLLNNLAIQIKSLSKMLPARAVNESILAKLEEKILNIQQYFQSQYANPNDFKKRVVIIDTNCLMQDLSLLDKVKPSDQVVVPTTVLHELDGLKQENIDGKWSDKAKKARAVIDRLDCSIIDYEQARPDLLDKMDKNTIGKPDLKILSVAAYYRLCNSILITNDKNLRNLANAEGIANQSTQRYLAGSQRNKKIKRK
ncbi:PIN domain-containing protein [Thalassotalea ponticola]|uniref:PIN domain-containing protein n=1 Tax=Thalassotalea ponticola TaxID=1523392 RepID=UPI0025B62875|nr:PIN domain-containing protein [Thalassotalea ponticola]MDN3651343.1 PIN domain-containing protein [Thalassotalea ponticola]